MTYALGVILFHSVQTTMTFRPFDTEKAVQAAAALIRRSGGCTMSKIRMAKLLYLANRKMLERHGRTIFDTRFVGMRYGPLSSDVQALIAGSGHDEEAWSQFIQDDGKISLILVGDPGNSRLSQAEVDVIGDIVEMHQLINDFDIVNLTHDFPEYVEVFPDGPPKEGDKGSRNIPLSSILRALKMDDDIEEIEADIAERAELDRLFHQ